MANLALSGKTMTAIWAGLCLAALAVFAMGFFSGVHWSGLRGADAAPRAPQAAVPPDTGDAPTAPPSHWPEQTEPKTAREPQEPASQTSAQPANQPEPVRQSAPEPQPSQEPEPEDTAPQVASTAPARQAEPLPEPAPEAAPATAPEPSSSEEPKVAAVPQPSPELPQGDRFFVQVASFRSLERAADMYAELVERGHDASVFTVFDSDDKPWYVLRVGEFATREDADRAGEEYRVREGSSFTVRAFDARLLRERTIAPESLPLEAEQ